MKVTTRKEFLANAAARWDWQYGLPSASLAPRPAVRECERISQALHALPPDATEVDVAAVIGNTFWTKLQCGECEEDVEAVVSVGAEPDVDSSTARICLKCARQAVTELIRAEDQAAGFSSGGGR